MDKVKSEEREVLTYVEDCFARNILSQIQAQHEFTEIQKRKLEMEESRNQRSVHQKKPRSKKSDRVKRESKSKTKKELVVKLEPGSDEELTSFIEGVATKGLVQNTSVKVRKLLQTSYKLIKFDKAPMGQRYVPVDGDIAQFLNVIDQQKNQGIASELLDRQMKDFAQVKGLSEEIVKTLMLRLTEERQAVKNAERMVFGKKFKVLGSTRDSSIFPKRGRPRKKVQSSDSETTEVEDIFIDDCIQMRAPKRKKMPFAHLIKKEVQEQAEELIGCNESTQEQSGFIKAPPDDFSALPSIKKIPQEALIEAPIEPFEDQQIDFCQHERAKKFVNGYLKDLISFSGERCCLNSLNSAFSLGLLSKSKLAQSTFKIERFVVLQILYQTDYIAFLSGFLQGGGLQALHDWLEFFTAKRIELKHRISRLEEQTLFMILLVLDKSPLSVDLLKAVRVGRLVNTIAQSECNDQIRRKAQQLVAEWKKLVASYKEQQQRTSMQMLPHYPIPGSQLMAGQLIKPEPDKTQKPHMKVMEANNQVLKLYRSIGSPDSDRSRLMQAVISKEQYLKYMRRHGKEPVESRREEAAGECLVKDIEGAQEPKISCELQDPTQQSNDLAKSDGILIKLLQIIKNDKACIIENRDIFTQILAAVDQKTVSQLFKTPSQELLQNVGQANLCAEVQVQVYHLIIAFYLSCNPILGTVDQKELQFTINSQERESFYQQAKEFFFSQTPKQHSPAATKPSQFQQPRQVSPPKVQQQSLGGSQNYTTLPQFQQQFYQSPQLSMTHQIGQLYQQNPLLMMPQAGLQLQQMLFQPSFFAQSSLINSLQSNLCRPKNYKTVPCRMYHGVQGCSRGDFCHFIHDPNYQGQEIPRDVLMRIRNENLQKLQTGQLSGLPPFNLPPQPQFQAMAPFVQSEKHDERVETTLEDQIKTITQAPTDADPMHLSMNNPVIKAALSHPYFNPAFTQQYYQQEEQYKRQQQAQLIANYNAQQAELSSIVKVKRDESDDEVKGIGQVGQSAAVDQQLKLLLDKKTQETHRKLLEQIKQEKERRREKFAKKQQQLVDHLGQLIPIDTSLMGLLPQTDIVEEPAKIVQTKQEVSDLKNELQEPLPGLRERVRSRSREPRVSRRFDEREYDSRREEYRPRREESKDHYKETKRRRDSQERERDSRDSRRHGSYSDSYHRKPDDRSKYSRYEREYREQDRRWKGRESSRFNRH